MTSDAYYSQHTFEKEDSAIDFGNYLRSRKNAIDLSWRAMRTRHTDFTFPRGILTQDYSNYVLKKVDEYEFPDPRVNNTE